MDLDQDFTEQNIYTMMQKQNSKTLSEEEELNDCFDIYVAISKIYKPHPDRLRDWVSHPKRKYFPTP